MHKTHTYSLVKLFHSIVEMVLVEVTFVLLYKVGKQKKTKGH